MFSDGTVKLIQYDWTRKCQNGYLRTNNWTRVVLERLVRDVTSSRFGFSYERTTIN